MEGAGAEGESQTKKAVSQRARSRPRSRPRKARDSEQTPAGAGDFRDDGWEGNQRARVREGKYRFSGEERVGEGRAREYDALTEAERKKEVYMKNYEAGIQL